MTWHSDGEGNPHVPPGSGVVQRSMTPAERRCATPRVPWGDLALAPLNGVLATVPAVVLAGLPLYLALWLAQVDAPAGWVGLLIVAVFGLTSAATFAVALGGFLRARARVDDDLLYDVVDDRVVDVVAAVEIAGDPSTLYLRLAGAGAHDGETIALRGDYVARLRRTGCFPSTALRLVQLPGSRTVLGLLPLGDAFPPAVVSGREHRPAELDGQPAASDVEAPLARAMP
jgi:hypothetical protein